MTFLIDGQRQPKPASFDLRLLFVPSIPIADEVVEKNDDATWLLFNGWVTTERLGLSDLPVPAPSGAVRERGGP